MDTKNFKNKATVLMPVYNADKYVGDAIRSLLSQTYEDFNILIINDGSTDNSVKIINQFKDKRIKVIHNKFNLGLISTLNKGIDLIDSEYIIRMDADDICYPQRIEKQIKYMDEHRSIILSGTWIEIFGDNIKSRVVKASSEDIILKTKLLFTCSIYHPTVIMRNNYIKRKSYKYDEKFKSVEDFALWQKISFTNKISNIQEVLLKYRINDEFITHISHKNVDFRDEQHIKVYRQGFDMLKIEYNQVELEKFRKFINGRLFHEFLDYDDLFPFLLKINRSINNERYDINVFNSLISNCYTNNCINANFNIKNTFKVYNNNLSDSFKYTTIERIKFIIKRTMKLMRKR